MGKVVLNSITGSVRSSSDKSRGFREGNADGLVLTRSGRIDFEKKAKLGNKLLARITPLRNRQKGGGTVQQYFEQTRMSPRHPDLSKP